MGNYTLWCLNRVATWNRRELADKLAVKSLFGAPRHNVQLGRRGPFDQDPAWEDKLDDDSARRGGILMYEESTCDEYFVPIVVKCIGDPARFRSKFGPSMTPAGRQLFEALLVDYACYFPPAQGADPVWRHYWDGFTLVDALWDVGMFTRQDGETPHAGYYEIVATRAALTGRAVLVGYSQGGIVARFLGWLDAHLMDQAARSIAAVITVQSPNHGSPLADRANANSVAMGLLGGLTGIGGFEIVDSKNPHTSDAVRDLVNGIPAGGSVPWNSGIGAICHLLEGMIHDTPADQGDKTNLVRTLRKWLTGLLPAPQELTAFEDMSSASLDDPRTILGRLVAAPMSDLYQGAIIGSDSSLDDLVGAALSAWWERLGVRYLLPKRWFNAVEGAYTHISMNEARAAAQMKPLQTRLAALFQGGIATSTATMPVLEPYAHDFISPSVSQALHALAVTPPGPLFLGNVVNPKGTHISGGEESHSGSDRSLVSAMLEALGHQLEA
jgi:hypothetical protein